jgi:hypothetical protein
MLDYVLLVEYIYWAAFWSPYSLITILRACLGWSCGCAKISAQTSPNRFWLNSGLHASLVEQKWEEFGTITVGKSGKQKCWRQRKATIFFWSNRKLNSVKELHLDNNLLKERQAWKLFKVNDFIKCKLLLGQLTHELHLLLQGCETNERSPRLSWVLTNLSTSLAMKDDPCDQANLSLQASATCSSATWTDHYC